MTLNVWYAPCCKKMHLSEPSTKIWRKIDPCYQQRKCRPLTIVSGNIRFMQIFAGVLWGGGVKRQWGNRKRRFPGILDAFHWPQNIWLWVTLTSYFALKSVFRASLAGWHRATLENNCVKTNEDRHILSRCKSSAWTLVSGNIRFVRIFGRVL